MNSNENPPGPPLPDSSVEAGSVIPCSLQDWINANKPADELIFGRAGIDQAIFIRDNLARCIAQTFEQFQNCATVIGTHTSKSVRLPVVKLSRPGLDVVIRDNFHNVAISVRREFVSDHEGSYVESLITDGFATVVNSVYCEGFPEEWLFSCYSEDKRRFTCHVGSKLEAYAFLRLVGLS